MVDRRKFLKKTALSTGAILAAKALSASNINIEEDELNRPNESMKPFYHGVASGDPLATQVIIWTRITPEEEGNVTVKWMVAKDEKLSQVVQSGEVTTNANVDYTVKVDVKGLSPFTTYYYQFSSGTGKSIVGRTKTTPLESFESLQFAVVSCSNYPAGFYNAFARIAEKHNLDAVIHLGDYFYEGTEREFDKANNPPFDRFEALNFVKNKQWWLHSYRKRYAISRLDPDLREAHKVHPFICVWDDHEIADNAYKDGANGHNPQEDGDWEVRKSAARQAYAEWIPIRSDGSRIYRTIRFGKALELIMLDTRLEARDKQIYDSTSPQLLDPSRTIVGKEQKQWLYNKLKTSTSQWKLVGSQVIFSQINVDWASFGGHFTDKVKVLQDNLLDYWEGYPVERDEVIDFITQNKLNNVIIASASMHCALALDVTKRATKRSRKGESATYDAATGKGSVAVEFATPSITSENFDEKIGSFYASTFQSLLNKKLPLPLGYNPNPHLKFVDLQRHGYYLLKISKERAEANFYFVEDILTKTNKEELVEAWFTLAGTNHLQKLKVSSKS